MVDGLLSGYSGREFLDIILLRNRLTPGYSGREHGAQFERLGKGESDFHIR